MTTTTITPRAWVGCLACYNDGRLIGEWLDADQLEDADELAAICTRPDHEELWCFDTDSLGVGECSPAEAATRARAVAQLLEQADELGIPHDVALEYVTDSNAPADAWPDLRDAFHCSADDETDYVLDYLENSGFTVPNWLHIDYRSSFEELTSGLTVYRHDGRFWLFYND